MKNIRNKNSGSLFFKSAAVLTLGSLISRVLGAAYKIPLLGALKSTGLGIYQTVFPIYALFISVGSGAVSLALSRAVSAARANNDLGGEKRAIWSAFIFSLFFSSIGAYFLFRYSDFIAFHQGNPPAALCYRFLALAVVFAGINGCVRGIFQGRLDMVPTAVSEIIESSAKPLFGLFLFGFFAQPEMKAAAAALAVTCAEAVSAIHLLSRLNLERKLLKSRKGLSTLAKKRKAGFFMTLIPAALSGLVMPLSGALDSFIVINALKVYTERPVGLYGLFSGGILTLLSVPAALGYGLAVAAVPSVARMYASGDRARAEKGVFAALTLTLFVSVPAAAFAYAFSGKLAEILFAAQGVKDISFVASLIRTAAPYAVFLPLLQTANSVLYGTNKTFVPVAAMFIGTAVKVGLELSLLSDPSLGVYGYALSINICYIVAVFVDLMYIIKDSKILLFAFKTLCSAAFSSWVGYLVMQKFGLFFGVAVNVVAYFALQTVLRCYSSSDLRFLFPKRKSENKKTDGKNIENLTT